MATRATYRFATGDTAYHHWDGYPGGAAHLLSRALLIGGDLSFDAFMHANEKAERTLNHAEHGDTEYRYDLYRDRFNAWCIKVQRRIDFSDAWIIEYRGDIKDWFTNNLWG